jgi:hypothetical protein
MGRNKPAFTGHTELRTTFQRKGGIKKGDNGAELRMWLIYTQLEHKQGYGYIYEVNYDGHVFYNVFKEHYDTNCEGGTTTLYPGENAFRENKYQWAWNARTLQDAKELLETFDCVYQ